METAFNPDVFRWARESAGLALEDAARVIGIVAASLLAIEQGEKAPSRTMLSHMAKAYHRSLLTFYLPAPPRKGDRGEDFRTVAADQTTAANAEVDALVRDLRARQRLVRTVLEDDEDTQPLAFIGSARVADGVAALVQSIEQQLGLTRTEYRQKNDAGEAFALLRERAEQAGVFVLLAGNLGSHHSAIPVSAFRGFAIADPIAPFIVINDGDAKAAWSFTLLHELAHLWLGATGVSGGVPEMKIERFCNEVAGAFLLSPVDLQALQVVGDDLDAQIQQVTVLANRWRVSRQMVAYSLFKTGRITREVWLRLETGISERWAVERRREKDKSKGSSGPSYYVVRRHRLGHAMLDFARRYTDAGALSPSKAAKVLGVKPRSVYPLLSLSA
ncbi:ImmA/IrrE family metallo-endopeptidase [Sphaerotilus sp.]|uniref:ImmA/IrrE family metallo-endopeptidase n=1 Tax=Sphaerotilus sp. TaxID=2093942 RepID=UPI0025FDE210|nr:ImmA/IrrE family metallo-endopeptidase [Sphaerotilus sp.]